VIVREDGDRLVIVRQADHARLSGRIAAAWGRSPWEAPRPLPAVTVGARVHDDAWLMWDDAPEVRDGRPLGFHEVDRVKTVSMYSAGVTAAVALDPYAGLLTSLHYSGFFTSHWGWQPFSTPDRFPEPQSMALRLFLQDERQRQDVLRRGLNLGRDDEAVLEANYKWLQLWDRISLDICRQSREAPWALDYPDVPVRYDGPETVALKFAMVTPGTYVLNPYPLLPRAFRVAIPAVTLRAGFSSREEFLEAWRGAREDTMTATIEGA
jgi:hypothetical protein